MSRLVSLATRRGRINAWRADPHVTPRGAVVIIQEIFGVNSHIRHIVEQYAAHGHAAIAPCLFESLEHGVELDYDEAGVEKGRELVERLGFDRALEGVEAAAEELRLECEHGKVAAVGFCWGGTVAFLANTRLGLPSVSYYGGRTVPFLHERPQAPMLFHFGENDPLIPPEDVQKHRDELAGAQIELWPAGHGFNCDQRADFDAESARSALQHTMSFLEHHLR